MAPFALQRVDVRMAPGSNKMTSGFAEVPLAGTVSMVVFAVPVNVPQR